MSDSSEELVPEFTDEQRLYFQKSLSEQSGKHLKLSPAMLTTEQRAELAHVNCDLRALDDLRVRQEFLRKYGQKAFSDLHLKFTRQEREKRAAEEQEKLLAQRKARQGRI